MSQGPSRLVPLLAAVCACMRPRKKPPPPTDAHADVDEDTPLLASQSSSSRQSRPPALRHPFAQPRPPSRGQEVLVQGILGNLTTPLVPLARASRDRLAQNGRLSSNGSLTGTHPPGNGYTRSRLGRSPLLGPEPELEPGDKSEPARSLSVSSSSSDAPPSPSSASPTQPRQSQLLSQDQSEGDSSSATPRGGGPVSDAQSTVHQPRGAYVPVLPLTLSVGGGLLPPPPNPVLDSRASTTSTNRDRFRSRLPSESLSASSAVGARAAVRPKPPKPEKVVQLFAGPSPRRVTAQLPAQQLPHVQTPTQPQKPAPAQPQPHSQPPCNTSASPHPDHAAARPTEEAPVPATPPPQDLGAPDGNRSEWQTVQRSRRSRGLRGNGQ